MPREFCPQPGVESRGGKRAAHYDDQVEWIPCDLHTLPGFTTNVEFGLDVGTGRAALGRPPDCPNPERNRYLIYVVRRHGAPVCETLDDTVAAQTTFEEDRPFFLVHHVMVTDTEENQVVKAGGPAVYPMP